jgi:xanthine dehydrogenase/oxidase
VLVSFLLPFLLSRLFLAVALSVSLHWLTDVIGEPPLFMGSAVFFAIRDALKAARAQFGETSILHLTSPATVERIRVSCADPILKRAWVEPKEGEKSFFISI